jgi:hypothetical protein
MARQNRQKEIYTVEIDRDLTTGIAVMETWSNEKGELHRPIVDGPAMIVRDAATGHVVDGQTAFFQYNSEIDPQSGEILRTIRPLRKHKPYRARTQKPKPE